MTDTPGSLQGWSEDPRHPDFGQASLGRLQWIIDWWCRRRDFAFIALPWWAPPECMGHTRPPGAAPDILIGPGALVASGEQSFLGLEAVGALSRHARWIGWTPCFRNESSYGPLRSHAFLKAELFVRTSEAHAIGDLAAMLEDTLHCWREMAFAMDLPDRTPRIETTGPASADLVLAGIELGSYGVRHTLGGATYLYGTAIAEPRWSQVWTRA